MSLSHYIPWWFTIHDGIWAMCRDGLIPPNGTAAHWLQGVCGWYRE